MDHIMRVDPDFKVLVRRLKKDLEDLRGRKLNEAQTTKFIKDTYPADMILRNLKKTKIREEVDEDFYDFLSF